MTPTMRNAAIAAAATLLPAIAAVAYDPQRARALPGRVTDRVRETFDGGHDVEADAKRILARLESLSEDLGLHTSRSRNLPLGALVAGGVLAAIAIPAALTAYFAPQRLRDARDAAYDYFSPEDEEKVQSELARVSERLDELNTDIEAQREANFDDVTAAARKG